MPESLSCYVMGPTFEDDERRSLVALLPTALPVLKDAYVAFAGVLKLMYSNPHHMVTVDDEHTNLLHALAAMKILRALQVSTPQDMALCLTLGTLLALFSYSAVGRGVYEISQHCLSTARPFIEQGMMDVDMEARIVYLTLQEIMDCLVHRRMPTIRSHWQRLCAGKDMIDRHLGLCVPLLPYYHDLCVASHSLANTTDASYMALIEKQLSHIQAELNVWRPSTSDQFLERFTSTEVIHLLAQARVYRLAALLVSHRLRYAFGVNDDQATVWANEIMSELGLVQEATKRPIRSVTLPFIAAAIEMQSPDARSQALHDTEMHVDQFTPAVQKATKSFLFRVWQERDDKLVTSWFDSTYKPCVVLASIDIDLFKR
ncbi:hypothetical protein RBB50_007726 [Rhinocladiella similis]